MKPIHHILGLVLILSILGAFPLSTQAQTTSSVVVALNPTDFAAGLNLGSATGEAYVDSAEGYVHITLNTNGGTLPEGVVLEGWLVDAGLNGGPGITNVSESDELLGAAYLNEQFADLAESAPFAQSTGTLHSMDGIYYELVFALPNANFSPYDAVVITAEADGNQANFDPRPGTPVLAGDIATGIPETRPKLDIVVGDENTGYDVILQVANTDPAYGALSGNIRVYASGRLTATINLNGATIPSNYAVEVWLIDAGLITNGPGTSNVSDADETYGVPFGDAAFDTAVDEGFYGLSMGVAQLDASGAYTLDVTFPDYNFSPYDAVLVTLETDGNASTGYDPRPGSPLMLGLAEAAIVFDVMGDDMAANLPVWQTQQLTNAATGEVFSIADLNAAGYTVFVEPMATWCSNCRRQQQTLINVFNSADSNQVVFISLSVETNLGDSALADYAVREGFGWTFVVADEALLGELVNVYGRTITNPPSTPHFVVFPDGSYSDLTTGFSSVDEINTLIAGQ